MVQEVGNEDPIAVKPKSWAELVRDNRDTGNGWTLTYTPPNEKLNAVVITAEEKEEGVKVWKNTLVGFVAGAKPGFREMQSFVNTRWKGLGVPAVHLL